MDRQQQHTYMVQRHWVRIGLPITFSDGERVVAVLESRPLDREGVDEDLHITVLVELPQAEEAGDE